MGTEKLQTASPAFSTGVLYAGTKILASFPPFLRTGVSAPLRRPDRLILKTERLHLKSLIFSHLKL
jgi:hypothetical protein